MDYLISPPDETDWRLDPVDFEAALVTRWPDAAIRPNAKDDLFAFDFTVALDGDTVDGGFERATCGSAPRSRPGFARWCPRASGCSSTTTCTTATSS
jgi:hypothetical protein